ncbi:hypothetical protein OIU84_003044 [Salix udensis]|uniref:Uncharacterized protein n=1 Tax=Salix udensis TaxID=889485 RepID=A0AAD6P5D2_9ROSI|nr:hypothetical protein OIU84_003044 [Salix udensis]
MGQAQRNEHPSTIVDSIDFITFLELNAWPMDSCFFKYVEELQKMLLECMEFFLAGVGFSVCTMAERGPRRVGNRVSVGSAGLHLQEKSFECTGTALGRVLARRNGDRLLFFYLSLLFSFSRGCGLWLLLFFASLCNYFCEKINGDDCLLKNNAWA